MKNFLYSLFIGLFGIAGLTSIAILLMYASQSKQQAHLYSDLAAVRKQETQQEIASQSSVQPSSRNLYLENADMVGWILIEDTNIDYPVMQTPADPNYYLAIKLSALGIKNALALSLAYAKENPKVKGKTSLDRLLREGKELKIIALQSKDVGQFKELAKQYGVLFAVIKDKAQNEKVDVMFKAEDVAKLNRIYEQLGYAIPKVTTADRKKDPTRRQSGDSLLTRGKNPLDIDPRPSVRATIMALKNAARKAEQAQEKVQDITAKEER